MLGLNFGLAGLACTESPAHWSCASCDSSLFYPQTAFHPTQHGLRVAQLIKHAALLNRTPRYHLRDRRPSVGVDTLRDRGVGIHQDRDQLGVRQVDADREFVGKMEATLPAGAMVFQLPIMEFPEMPAPGVPPYDHFRSYLYSKNLRYSFGSMKGRPREAWQKELGKRSLEEAVAEIKKRGFAAIYINRNGFPDRALPVEKALRAMGYTKPPIVSATGDLVCIPLEKP